MKATDRAILEELVRAENSPTLFDRPLVEEVANVEVLPSEPVEIDYRSVKIPLKDQIIFWGWDMLSMFGSAEHIALAWKLLIAALIITFLHSFVIGSWASLIGYGIIPIVLISRITIKWIKVLFGSVGGLTLLYFFFSYAAGGFMAIVQTWEWIIFFYLGVVALGWGFNRYLVPGIIASLTGLTTEELAKAFQEIGVGKQ